MLSVDLAYIHIISQLHRNLSVFVLFYFNNHLCTSMLRMSFDQLKERLINGQCGPDLEMILSKIKKPSPSSLGCQIKRMSKSRQENFKIAKETNQEKKSSKY